MNLEMKLQEAAERGKASQTYKQLQQLANEEVRNDVILKEGLNGLSDLIAEERQ